MVHTTNVLLSFGGRFMEINDRVILALDGLSPIESLDLARSVGQDVYALKIHSLWDAAGPQIVSRLKDAGARRVWVDLKLYDIPKTVGLRACAVRQNGADILTVAANCGREAMEAAVENGPDEVYAVTVLTSLSDDDIRREHTHLTIRDLVVMRAAEARAAGVHGVVCSPHPNELGLLAKDKRFALMKRVTPGVRSAGVSAHDQKRITTPSDAILNGATHIVVGRQVTQAEDWVEALSKLHEELAY